MWAGRLNKYAAASLKNGMQYTKISSAGATDYAIRKPSFILKPTFHQSTKSVPLSANRTVNWSCSTFAMKIWPSYYLSNAHRRFPRETRSQHHAQIETTIARIMIL
jgi:hypothetical protein